MSDLSIVSPPEWLSGTREPSPAGAPEATVRSEPSNQVIAKSSAMQAVLADARQFAASDLPILITGEAGTGKALVARFVHGRSRRHGAPFLAQHCGALPASLTDLELFGQGRGVFAGAGAKRGLAERAQGGTLFLDEIGELPSSAQTGLLHLLQTRQILRVGERVPIRVDLRLVTGITLSEPDRIASSALRPDLYYRLNVLRLHVPPLRARVEDIGPLAELFLEEIGTRVLGRGCSFTPDAIAALCSHRWPGNVRELMGVVQRVAMASTREQITAEDLHLEAPSPPAPTQAASPGAHRPQPGSSAELNALLEVLTRTRFNITRAAAELSVSRVTFYRMLKRNNLELRQDWVLGRDAKQTAD